MKYRVWCSFVVEASSIKQVEQFLYDDGDFIEKHIIIGKAEEGSVIPLLQYLAEDDEPYAILEKGGEK